jgi:signal transduction histidine kinase
MRFGVWARAVSLWQRIGARARDIGFIAVSLLTSVGYLAAGVHRGLDGRVLPFAIAAGGSIALWWRRRAPLTVAAIGLAVFAITLMPVPQAVGLFTLAVRRRDRVLVAMTIISAIAFAIGTSLGTNASWPSLIFVGSLEAGFCAAAGSYIGARVDLVASLRDRADRAEAERELRAEQARLGERARIAQEMHDVLAHKVSLIALHAGALEVTDDSGADTVQRTAGLIRSTAREAMEDLRDVLGVLRSGDLGEGLELTPQPRLADIERIVEASRAAGVRVDLAMNVDELPDSVARTAYRIVQEGLTNVHKHARGAATSVSLDGDPQRGITVEVVNQRPVSAATLLPGSGAGLVGLRERIALAGGTMQSGACGEGGWRMAAWLPWAAA